MTELAGVSWSKFPTGALRAQPPPVRGGGPHLLSPSFLSHDPLEIQRPRRQISRARTTYRVGRFRTQDSSAAGLSSEGRRGGSGDVGLAREVKRSNTATTHLEVSFSGNPFSPWQESLMRIEQWESVHRQIFEHS